MTALHLAVQSGHTNICTAILRRTDSSELNATATDGQTFLHWAALWGQTDVCRTILARQDFTKAHARNSFGKKAVDLALQNGWTYTAQAILICSRPESAEQAPISGVKLGAMALRWRSKAKPKVTSSDKRESNEGEVSAQLGIATKWTLPPGWSKSSSNPWKVSRLG